MDGRLNPVFKRQAAFLVAALAVGFVLTYFFDFIVGMAANIAILVGAIFYIHWRQGKALATLGLGGRDEGVKLKYVCLACGAEFKGARCAKCGSSMKKPLF